MICGVNHITLAVADLPRAVSFYTDVLGAVLRADWPQGAYLDLGGLWLCLALENAVTQRNDDTHIAFSTDTFAATAAKIKDNASLWKTNTSEGASVYFCDPDGHKLELHDGTLESRLRGYAARADNPVTIYAAGDVSRA